MAYLVAGPLVALVGIVAVFFVLRRKSVEKRSMYSARRSQIEHKVRAARQRTLAPHGRAQKPRHPRSTTHLLPRRRRTRRPRRSLRQARQANPPGPRPPRLRSSRPLRWSPLRPPPPL